MKTLFKRAFFTLLAISLLLSLGSCSLFGNKGLSTGDVALYIQGTLDETYRGTASAEYLKLVDSTAEDSRAIYLDKLQSETDYFVYYFDIVDPSDEITNEIIELYKQIYAKSKYLVGAASKIDDNTWGVMVEVQPLDIFQVMTDNWDTYPEIAAFQAKYDGVDVNGMTDDEHIAYEYDWARGVLDVCRQLLPQAGYLDTKSLLVQVKLGDDGYWTTNSDDMTNLDYMIVTYP